MRTCSGGSTSILLQLHDALLPDYDPEATYLLSIEAIWIPGRLADCYP